MTANGSCYCLASWLYAFAEMLENKGFLTVCQAIQANMCPSMYGFIQCKYALLRRRYTLARVEGCLHLQQLKYTQCHTHPSLVRTTDTPSAHFSDCLVIGIVYSITWV